MEVAALTSLGQFSPHPTMTMVKSRQSSSLATSSQLPPSPLISKKHRNRSLSTTRHKSSELVAPPPLSSTEGLLHLEPSHAFWDQFSHASSPASSDKLNHSDRLSENTSTLSSRQSEELSPSTPTLNSRSSKTGSLSSMSMRSKSSTLP